MPPEYTCLFNTLCREHLYKVSTIAVGPMLMLPFVTKEDVEHVNVFNNNCQTHSGAPHLLV